MGNALGLELARFRKTNVISGCANDGAFWLKRLPTADSESLPTVLVAAMPRYVGIRTRFNLFPSRKIPARYHHMFANLFDRSGMVPRSPNLRQAAHYIGSKAPVSIGGSVQNQIAVSGVERDQPVVNYRFGRLQPSVP